MNCLWDSSSVPDQSDSGMVPRPSFAAWSLSRTRKRSDKIEMVWLSADPRWGTLTSFTVYNLFLFSTGVAHAYVMIGCYCLYIIVCEFSVPVSNAVSVWCMSMMRVYLGTSVVWLFEFYRFLMKLIWRHGWQNLAVLTYLRMHPLPPPPLLPPLHFIIPTTPPLQPQPLPRRLLLYPSLYLLVRSGMHKLLLQRWVR